MKNKYSSLSLLLLLFLLISCSRNAYQKFIHQSKGYYKKIAVACDKLLVQSEQAPNTWKRIKTHLELSIALMERI